MTERERLKGKALGATDDEKVKARLAGNTLQGTRFRELRIGDMVLVEDKGVEDAVDDYWVCLTNPGCGQLVDLGKRLAYKCRDSIGEGWEVNVSSSALRSETQSR